MSSLSLWTPTDVFFRDRLNRMFDRAFSPSADDSLRAAWVPAVDIRETPEEILLSADVPGLGKEDINITVENNTLTLSGERRFEKDVKEESFHRVERSYGAFSRSFALPGSVQLEKIAANFKDGVLTIRVPKEERAKPKKIAIA
ncbi:MAG: Hsp20/alpha crystallin family protein [Acidobacteriota bacterium]